MKRILMLVVLGVLMSGTAHAEIAAECGASAGYSFYLQGSFVPASKSGWTDDKISKGSTSIVLINEKFDVLYSDRNSKNRSSCADGGKSFCLAQMQLKKASPS